MRKQFYLLAALFICMLLLAGCSCQHEWQDATCTAPKTCSLCKEIEGEPMGHTPGEWQITQEATIETRGIKEQACLTCHEVIQEESYALDTHIQNGKYTFMPSEFGELLLSAYPYDYYDYTYQLQTENTPLPLSVDIYESGTRCGTIYFHTPDGTATQNAHSNDISTIVLIVPIDPPPICFDLMLATMIACDPARSVADAAYDLGLILAAAQLHPDEYVATSRNGLQYELIFEADAAFLRIRCVSTS